MNLKFNYQLWQPNNMKSLQVRSADPSSCTTMALFNRCSDISPGDEWTHLHCPLCPLHSGQITETPNELVLFLSIWDCDCSLAHQLHNLFNITCFQTISIRLCILKLVFAQMVINICLCPICPRCFVGSNADTHSPTDCCLLSLIHWWTWS